MDSGIKRRKNIAHTHKKNVRQVVDCPTCEADCGNSYQASCHLLRHFFINPHTPAFIFNINPKMNSPKTLTIDKCLLKKTISSRIPIGYL